MPSPVGVSILPTPAEVLPISSSVYSFKPIQKHQHERRSDISGTQFDMQYLCHHDLRIGEFAIGLDSPVLVHNTSIILFTAASTVTSNLNSLPTSYYSMAPRDHMQEPRITNCQ